MSNANLARVERILKLLQEARERRLSCFGSGKHKFQLNAPLSEEELTAYEARHRIRLPEDFQTFIEHAGNGGAGPYYGIKPLETQVAVRHYTSMYPPEDLRLDRPCPLYPNIVSNGKELTDESDWIEQFGDTPPYQGTLNIGTQGCTYEMVLVITGTHRGRVVYIDTGDASPPVFVYEPDFLSWYERWLKEFLQGYDTDWFGFLPGGDEDDCLRILSDPQASEEDRYLATNCLARLPRISDAAVGKLHSYLHDPAALVRAGACATIRKFHTPQSGEQIARLLDDPVASVRKEAIGTLMALEPNRWSPRIFRLVFADDDSDVAEDALHELNKAEAVTRTDFLDIIAHAKTSGLRAQAVRKMTWSSGDVALLTRLLSDTHSGTRSASIGALQKIRAVTAIPNILDLLACEKDTEVISTILLELGLFGDRSAVPILLKYTQSASDFLRLDAIRALAKIGDPRAIPIAEAMLKENRNPTAPDREAFHSMSYLERDYTISYTVRRYLKDSPLPALRELASQANGAIWSQ